MRARALAESLTVDGRTPIAAHFSEPDFGWIELTLPDLATDRPVFCSWVFDPFPSMMVWLNQIAAGRAVAAWGVDEEGSSAHLVFIRKGSLFDEGQSTLILLRGFISELVVVEKLDVTPHQVVSGIYSAFRRMVSSPTYRASHWEASPDIASIELIDDEDEYDAAKEAWPFDGAPLSQMRSPGVEAFIADPALPVSPGANTFWDGMGHNQTTGILDEWDAALTDPLPLSRTTGEFFREEIMPAYHLTTAGLAKAIGVSRSHLHRVLSGKSALTTELAWRIGAYLGSSVSDILLAHEMRWNRERSPAILKSLRNEIRPMFDLLY